MPRKKEYDKNVVLEKAMHTFWEHGYESTSMRILESNMGINQFSIYAEFENKQQLFVAVLKKYKVFVQENMIDSLVNSSCSVNEIHDFFLSYGQSIRNGSLPYGCLMVNTCNEIGRKEVETRKIVKSYFDFIQNSFQKILTKAKANGELSAKSDVKILADFLLVSLQGLSSYAKFYSDKKIQNYVSMTMNNLK